MSGDPVASVRRMLRHGITLITVIVVSVAGWACATDISGAVVAEGLLVVESSVKKIQHQTGGIVSAIKVSDGSQVAAGDVLLTLDDTIARAAVSIADATLGELTARQLRLEAERDGRATLLASPNATAQTRLMLPGEQRLLELRASARTGQRDQLRERIVQAREQINGLNDQILAKQDELAFVRREIVGVRQLFAANLVPISRLTALERDMVRIDGDARQLRATVEATRGKITETELQIEQIEQDLRSELAKDLREVAAKIAEATEKKIAAKDQLRRVDIRAPQAGVVDQLAVHTVGGTVTPAEDIMIVVPTSDDLAVEVRITPDDVNQVHVGQSAGFRLPALSARTTPELLGEVTQVGADAETEKQTGRTYYTVRLSLPPAQIARLNGARLVPGMPVEAFIRTGERSVLSLLVKPMSDRFNHAFRER